MWTTVTKVITGHPVLVLMAIGALFIAALIPLSTPRFDISLEAFITEEDKQQYKYNQFIQAFGEDNDILILLRTEKPFSNDTLSRLAILDEQASRSSLTQSTFSLLDVFTPPAGPATAATLQPLIPDLPAAKESLQQLQRTVMANPFFKRSLISENSQITTFYITLEQRQPTAENRRKTAAFLTDLQKTAKEEFGAENAYFAGWPYIKTEMQRAVRNDLMVIAPAIVIVSFIFMWFSFGNLRMILISGATVLVVISLTLGLFFLLGNALHMATAMLPTLIIAISFAQSIFILSHFLRAEGSIHERVKETIPGAGAPVMLGAITTAGGFASLLAIPIAPIRDFGLFAAIGILISFFISMLAIPALLLLLKPERGKSGSSERERRLVKRLQRINRRPGLLAFIGVAILLSCALGIAGLGFETNLKNFFQDSHPVNQGTEALKEMFGASNAIDFIVERQDGGRLSGSDYRNLAEFLQWINGKNQVVFSQGIIGAGSFIAGGSDEFAGLVDTAGPLIPALFDSNELLSRYLSKDGTMARITLFATDDSAEKGIELGRFIDDNQEELPGLRIIPSGQSILFAGMSGKLFEGQVNSVLVILGFVTVLITITLRSPGIGLLSLVPNSAPILLTLGVMGWTGIPLNVITVMVSSVAIGIAVDDTIHFLYHYRSKKVDGADTETAVMDSLRAKSRPIFYTSFVLSGAFLTHMLSVFKPTQYLGMLSAMTMAGALAGDLFLLPALLNLTRRRRKEK